MQKQDTISRILCPPLREAAGRMINHTVYPLEEIRLRVNRPAMAYAGRKKMFLTSQGRLSDSEDEGIQVTSAMLEKTLELMSNYSLYAYEQELKNGYITLEGGHRVGLCGKVVADGDRIKTIRFISSLNIRIAHEIIGCADEIMPWIRGAQGIYHTLLISPPRCGKTTLLRDLIRQISDGEKMQVGVVDERSEIAGCYRGIPQNTVGLRTDILDGCPKQEGMLMLLRSMGPQVIAVDEIGRIEEIQAITTIVNSGVKLLCTIHGNSLDDFLNKPGMDELAANRVFQRIIVLSGRKGPGTLEQIYDGEKGDYAVLL